MTRERIVTPSQVAALTAKVEGTDDRLDVLRSDITELRGEVRAMDNKLDQVVVTVAKLTVTSGPGITISPKMIKVIGGILAAIIVAVAQALTGASAGDDEKPATEAHP